MTQNDTKKFSYGLEFASLVVSSGILPNLCELISELHEETPSNQNLFLKKVTNEETGLTILTFGTSQNHVEPSLLEFKMDMDPNPFKFICSKENTNFSLNKSAYDLFMQHGTQLDQLKSEMDLKKPVIVTGHGVGGAIASLFNLWLLEKMDPMKDKFPLCITFGSPLIGDKKFQLALSQSSHWNSCFLHVASLEDPLVSSVSNNLLCPFGIFLLCSSYGSSSFESPDSVLKLLSLITQQQSCDYLRIAKNLSLKAICKGFDEPKILHSHERQTNLTLQLCSLGFHQLPQENDLESLVKELDSEEGKLIRNKKRRFVPNKKLDQMKVNMAHLEWYKKKATKEEGYYNMFKNDNNERDQDVVRMIKELDIYWKEMVNEVEKKPQKEGAAFRTRWLFSGTNYRRMVEPLRIAQHYKEGKRDYINQRPDHYKKLEEWLEYEKKPHDSSTTKQNIQSILTLDSLFWARVEETVIVTQVLKDKKYKNEAEKQHAMNSLVEFEKYVYELLKNYSVSPEIFLGGTSFMHWWGNVKKINEVSHDNEFENFMENRANYEKYKEGAYNFP